MPTCQNKGKYLLVEFNEPYSLKLFLTTIHEVAEHCREENLNKVLIDITKMEGNPSIFERYRTGIEIVKVWGPRIKAALVTKPSMINHMVENTAVNRGAKLFVTTEMTDALEWLGLTV